jgi:hypothetical protein
MKYVALRNCAYRTERGRYVSYIAGAEVTEAKYNALPTSVCRHFVTKRKYNQRQDWSVAEHNHVIDLYLKYVDVDGNYDAEAIFAEHQALYPTRGTSAINMQVCQIRGLDNYVPQKGLTDTSSQLIDLLHSRNPNRFNGEQSSEAKMHNHLDALLVSVRG